MKKTVCILLVLILLVGCAPKAKLNEAETALLGSWAYIHDTGTAILTLHDTGEARFHDEKYTFTADSEFITLTRDGQTLRLRYAQNGDGFLLYEPADYEAEGETDGLLGKWVDAGSNWSFEFTADGTFLEDGYFPGLFTSDDSTVKLVYNDHFEDTTLYYTIDGKTLHLEYPWQLVPVEK